MFHIGEFNMKKYENATLDEHGNWIDVFECEVCHGRTIFKDNAIQCEKEHIRLHHLEEAEVGWL